MDKNLFLQRIIFLLEKSIFLFLKKSIKFYFPSYNSSIQNNALSKKRVEFFKNQIEIISQKIEFINSKQDPYQGAYFIDQKIATILPEILSEKTFFIEAGANDGISQSNTYFLEKKYGARGMLIEPSASNFEKCYVNRSQKNIYEHCALVSENFEGEYVEMIFDNLRTSKKNFDKYEDIVNFDNINIKKWTDYQFLSPTKTLSSLISKHNINKVDFLSLDTEGSEFDILNGSNLKSGIIKNILVEIRDRNKNEIFNLLKKYNYKFITKLNNFDFLFSYKSNTF